MRNKNREKKKQIHETHKNDDKQGNSSQKYPRTENGIGQGILFCHSDSGLDSFEVGLMGN